MTLAKWKLGIITFGFSGLLPKMPGTWGTLAALIVLVIPEAYFYNVLVLLIPLTYFISLPLITEAEKYYGEDASIIVIDEALGMWIILLNPIAISNPFWLILAVALFRYFDISKVWGINRLNEKKGAKWVMLDDVLAAIYTYTCLSLLHLLYNNVLIYYFFS